MPPLTRIVAFDPPLEAPEMPQETPRALKRTPRSPKRPQRGPKRPQRGPKTPQEAQDCPRLSPARLQGLKTAPRLEVTTKHLKDAPDTPKSDSNKCVEMMSAV